jgi:hypothetical protein
MEDFYYREKSSNIFTVGTWTSQPDIRPILLNTLDRRDIDYQWKLYTNVGHSSGRKEVEFYRYCCKRTTKEGLDILGIFSWLYTRARNIMRERPGFI